MAGKGSERKIGKRMGEENMEGCGAEIQKAGTGSREEGIGKKDTKKEDIQIEGFLKVATATPKIRVADTDYNASQIISAIREAEGAGARILVLPELCVTGYTCGDLFLQSRLLDSAQEALDRILAETGDCQILVILGYPLYAAGKLYNTAAVLQGGRVLGFVPKRHIPNYGEFYEARWFTPASEEIVQLIYEDGRNGEPYGVFFGMNLLFEAEEIPELCLAVEICEDLWVPCPPSIQHAQAGATVLCNCSASSETVGKDSYRRELVRSTSARLVCAYLYADAGEGESSQDLLFSGQNLIAENGILLAEGKRFAPGIQYAELDLELLRKERLRMSTYPAELDAFYRYTHVAFSIGAGQADAALPSGQSCAALPCGKTAARSGNAAQEGAAGADAGSRNAGNTWNAGNLPSGKGSPVSPGSRFVDPQPFVPGDEQERAKRCEDIFRIQAMGLKKRMEHIGAKRAVIGVSGGLDSTLALLVTARTFDLLGLPRTGILAVTMPAFGTSGRTYQNALRLMERLGTSIREVDIRASLLQHFADIGHDPENHNVAYENAQARERTQVLMDLANDLGGIVVGTGDLSELALGWATYNGDHMSMYGVNAGVPKTLVRHLVRFVADTTGDAALATTLLDVLDTPVSPELLPPEEGQISQKTEDLLGPYELHDFFLFQVLRYGFSPRKVYALALRAFGGENPAYDSQAILHWLKNFYCRFFSQQYKRSCLPDGPKVGSISLSPRGDLRMPSDAVCADWLRELEAMA